MAFMRLPRDVIAPQFGESFALCLHSRVSHCVPSAGMYCLDWLKISGQESGARNGAEGVQRTIETDRNERI